VTLGKPECWCYDCHCKGDANGDCIIDAGDAMSFVADWNSYGPCGDTDYDQDVDAGDAMAFVDGWNNGCPAGCVPE
jgi:hypothetical protein